jgi:hypothetical protein
MAQAKCPVCGCDTFYCKNPEDEYDTKTFKVVDGSAVPRDPEDGDWPEDMTSETEAYCDRCTWHAPFGDVTKR